MIRGKILRVITIKSKNALLDKLDRPICGVLTPSSIRKLETYQLELMSKGRVAPLDEVPITHREHSWRNLHDLPNWSGFAHEKE